MRISIRSGYKNSKGYGGDTMKKTLKERFDEKWKVNLETGCWEWIAGKSASGYGHFKINNKQHVAHRVAYEIYNGLIPDGMFILHKCDNPLCVNPEHLEIGTHQDNMYDKVSKNRQSRSTRRTTVEEKINIINDSRNSKEVALSYNLTYRTVKRIREKARKGFYNNYLNTESEHILKKIKRSNSIEDFLE